MGAYGLSPPVRGKPGAVQSPAALLGSIPARAGETMSYSAIMSLKGVYPRPCGGNWLASSPLLISKGLSPPVRGKRGYPHSLGPFPGSIPARAGETSPTATRRSRGRVYPRPCGGNAGGSVLSLLGPGLSPPVRGKHQSGRENRLGDGSIPARAGETRAVQSAGRPAAVYPRPCGGNRGVCQPSLAGVGLSPPVRGKQYRMT